MDGGQAKHGNRRQGGDSPFAPVIEVPEVTTGRLRLRGHRPEDLAARIAVTGDEQVMRLIGGPQSAEESWARILRYNGHWGLFGYGLYAVEERATGTVIGEAGLADFGRGLGPDFDPYPEGAWLLSAAGQGQGYATEAMQGAITAYEARFGPTRMVCVIAPENGASLRVAAKLGFVAFAERAYKGRECVLLAREAGG